MSKLDDILDETKAVTLKQKFEAERNHNFATVDPKTCKHTLVYHKQGDDMHCNFCDKFMYDISKD